MSDWRSISSAPRDGTPILLAKRVESNDINGYAPWKSIDVVIAWWDNAWEICFMYDGAADTYGHYSTHFETAPDSPELLWMPLPKPPIPTEEQS